MTGVYPMGNQVDHAVSAFIEDVHQRGLSEKILLVVTGEMGRTRVSTRTVGAIITAILRRSGFRRRSEDGPDHWRERPQAAEPATRPYTPKHLMSTIMHTLFDIGELRVADSVPKPVADISPAVRRSKSWFRAPRIVSFSR